MSTVIIDGKKREEKLNTGFKIKIFSMEKNNELSLDLQLFYMRKTRTGHLEAAGYEQTAY